MSPRSFDPVLVEVVQNELAAITEEMAIAVWKTGRSAMVKTGDFATALCDARGRVIGQGYAAPFQLGFFMEVMAHLVPKYEGRLAPGDLLITNDPYGGITHMPDVLIVAPAFWRGDLVGYTMAYSHHTDIGGRFPGGFSSQCTVSYEEGVRLPGVKLAERGARNEALLETLLANVRLPEEWIGDLDAKIAGCYRGEKELGALLDRHGRDTLDECCDYLIARSETATRRALAALPDGRYEHSDVLEDDGFGSEGVALPLHLAVEVRGETLRVDFSGTAPQASGAINLPLSLTRAAVYAVVKSLVDAEVLTNAGFARPLEIVAPEGTLVNPRFPAAVGGRAPLFFRVIDMLYRALAKAEPTRIPIPGEGGDVLHLTGTHDDGSPYALLDIFFGGWGGRPTDDGIDGVAPMEFGSYGTVPAEMIEREFPVVVDGFGYVPDSGGPGRFRGSLSIYRAWRFRGAGSAMIRTNRPTRVSAGMDGGAPGALSQNRHQPCGKPERDLPKRAHTHLEVRPGDTLVHSIAGSGGHGDPFARDPARVLEDVRAEKVSVAGARRDYGVVVDAETWVIDEAATDALRAARAPGSE